MDKLSKDELFLIAIDLDMPSLINFCQTSKNVNRKVCENNYFWVHKLKKDFNIDFKEISKMPKSSRLREKYMKSLPAKKEYLQYSKIVETYTIPNHLLSAGIEKNKMDWIKIALYRGTVYDSHALYNAINKNNIKTVEYCMDDWINSKESSILIIKDFLDLTENLFGENRGKYALILYDIILPRAAKYIPEKKFWKQALLKLIEFNENKEQFHDVYIRRIDFYKKLAE
jgi:hypothetical protein